MTSFTNLRKQVPALLMSTAQREALKMTTEIPEGEMKCCGYVTRNMVHCPELKASLESDISTKNVNVQKEFLAKVDDYLGQLAFYRRVGQIDPMAGKRLLTCIKGAHDLIRSVGDRNKVSKIIGHHIDEVSALMDTWVVSQSQGTAVDVPTPTTTPVTIDSTLDEGVDFRMSKAYYDAKAKKWIQRKVDNVDKDREKTYEKEVAKIFRTERTPTSVKESASFKDYFVESELNTLNRLQPEGDVIKNQDDSVYTKKKEKSTKPSFKVACNVQADPLSS